MLTLVKSSHVFSMEPNSLCGLLVPELPSCRNGLDTQHKQPHDP